MLRDYPGFCPPFSGNETSEIFLNRVDRDASPSDPRNKPVKYNARAASDGIRFGRRIFHGAAVSSDALEHGSEPHEFGRMLDTAAGR